MDVSASRLASGLPLALFLTACASLDLPPMGSIPGAFAPEPDERRIWTRSEEEQQRLNRTAHLYGDAGLEGYLSSVLKRVTPAEVKQGPELNVRVLKNPLLNAFAYPNGVIYVHTGMLAQMDNEAQLATLLAHELTHVTHRHTVQQFRNLQNKAAFASTIGVLAAPFGAYGAIVSLIGTVGVVAAVSGYSQEHELEADREGLARMVDAGYDPREAPKLFAHLKEWVEDEEEKEPFFFGTHPRLAERMDSYEQLLAGEFEAAAERGGRLGEAEFLAQTRVLVLENSVLDLQAGRFVQAQKGLRRYLTSSPDDVHAYHYLAESYRRQNNPELFGEAIQHYQKAIDLDPTFADPYRGLGTLYYQQGDRAKAQEAFRQYLVLAPAAEDELFIEGLLKELAESGSKP